MNPVELLRLRIAESGLSISRFARDVVVRDPRTVHRWLAGTRQMPKAVVAKLERMEPTNDNEVTDNE